MHSFNFYIQNFLTSVEGRLAQWGVRLISSQLLYRIRLTDSTAVGGFGVLQCCDYTTVYRNSSWKKV